LSKYIFATLFLVTGGLSKHSQSFSSKNLPEARMGSAKVY